MKKTPDEILKALGISHNTSDNELMKACERIYSNPDKVDLQDKADFEKKLAEMETQIKHLKTTTP